MNWELFMKKVGLFLFLIISTSVALANNAYVGSWCRSSDMGFENLVVKHDFKMRLFRVNEDGSFSIKSGRLIFKNQSQSCLMDDSLGETSRIDCVLGTNNSFILAPPGEQPQVFVRCPEIKY
jgi:hypothetical protein